jgi:hypothetical protein
MTRQTVRYLLGVSLIAAVALTAPKADASWALTTLHSFTGGSDGAVPWAGVISDSAGALYGTTQRGGGANSGTVYNLIPSTTAGGAWTETVLYSFTGGSDGAQPLAGLIFGTDAALYGTTVENGNMSCPFVGGSGCGTVFKLTPPTTAGGAWTHIVLYTFQPTDFLHTNYGDGEFPFGGLVMDTSGALYGTTNQGGIGGPRGRGTVYKLTPPTSAVAWTENILHAFNDLDGTNPYGGLIMDASGALYGTTDSGGISGAGTIFTLTPPITPGGAWNYSVLYSFSGGTDGGHPFPEGADARLIMDASGALYGTTYQGGKFGNPTPCHVGCGTVFKLSPPTTDGGTWTYKVLYSFTGGGDGGDPFAGVIMDASGALYGSTELGGNSSNCIGSFEGTGGCGVIFKLTPPTTAGGAWTETVLYSFTGGSDGGTPFGTLLFDTSGVLYGTTTEGGIGSGIAGFGTVFKLAAFAGVPGQPNCIGTSISALVQQYGGITAAVAALGYSSVQALQNAVAAYCGG